MGSMSEIWEKQVMICAFKMTVFGSFEIDQ